MDRSPYLLQALQAMQQNPTSQQGLASGLGAQALLQFAQQRRQRALADALQGGGNTAAALGGDMGPGLLSRIGGLAQWAKGGF